MCFKVFELLFSVGLSSPSDATFPKAFPKKQEGGSFGKKTKHTVFVV